MTEYKQPIRREARATSRIEVADVSVARDFDRAKRHSGRVRLLRIAIPVVIVAGAAGYFLSAGVPGTDLPIDFDDIVITGEGVVIENPRVAQYALDLNQAYELVADRAIQPGGEPNRLLLEGVRATYTFASGEVATFTAPNGTYDANRSIVALSGGVVMAMGEAIDIRLASVTIDVVNNTIVTEEAFEMTAGNFIIRGNALELTPEDMRVAGGVQTILAADGTTPPLPRIGTVAP